MKKKVWSFIRYDKVAESSGAGGTYILAIVFVFIFLLFSVILNKLYTIYTLTTRVTETMKEACIYVMTSNWDELFHSVREGYAGAYNYEGEELIDPDRVYDIMQEELGTEKLDNSYVKYDDNGNISYKYYNIEMKINNTGYKNTQDSYSIDLKLFFGTQIDVLSIHIPLEIELKNRAKWRAKY